MSGLCNSLADMYQEDGEIYMLDLAHKVVFIILLPHHTCERKVVKYMLVLALNVVFIYLIATSYMWKEGGKIYVGFSP